MRWQRQAEQVGSLLPRTRLHPAVLEWAARSRSRGPWCIALSGGSDSLALALLLWSHFPERRGRLVALHFNHRLRGRESAGDAAFCRRVCAGLGIDIVVGEWDAPRAGASEAVLRNARQIFFQREMNRLGSRVLWLAHQQDDIAESMLMRLARGSGTGGLTAPRPVHAIAAQRVHLRPLLDLKKQELVTALQAAGVAWREDRSNASATYFRNRIRGKVIPAWIEAAGRDAVAGAAWSRGLLEEDDAALEEWLDRLDLINAGTLDVRACASLPKGVVRRALHRWLHRIRANTDLSRRGFSGLMAIVIEGADTRFSLGEGFAVIRRGKLAYAKK